MSNPITIETIGNVLVVRFTRPENRNPLSVDMLKKLDVILDGAFNASDVEKIVFTGSGNAFAAGADLREIAGLNAENTKDFSRQGQKLMNKIAGFPKPTVAAINGFCFGGALDLALACTGRIAVPSATFAHPGASLGIITGWGGTQRLPRLIGQGNALEMFFTASPITAVRGLQIGLIDSISDDPLAAAI